MVGLGLCERGGHDWRALGSDGGADGHEEAGKTLAREKGLLINRLGDIPESGSRSDHVLAEGSHHAIGSRAESDDVGCAEDEANDQADSC